MRDEVKTKRQLISELKELRQFIYEHFNISEDSAYEADLNSLRESSRNFKETQERFMKSFLQSAIPMGLTTEKEGSFIEVNEAFLRLIGVKKDEVIGKSSTELGLITEEQRSIIVSELSKKGKVDNHEVLVKTKNGNFIHGLFNIVMMSLGKEKYFLTVMTDFTEYKRLAKELMLSERKYRDLFESVPIGIFRSSLEGRYLDANPFAAKLLGYDSPEDLMESVTDIGTQIYLHSEDRNKAFQLLATQGYIHNFEAEFIQKNGNIALGSLNAKIVRDEKGNSLYIQGISQDISVKKQMENKLRDMVNFLHTLFNTIPSPIFCKDINGIYVDCNREFEKYTGLERKHIIGKSVYEMFPQDVADEYHEKDLELFRQPGRQIYEHQIVYADGDRHDVIVNKATYLNADGSLAGLVGVMVDITERKRAEVALRRSETKFRTLYDSTNDAVMLTNEKGFLDCNKKTLEIFGCTSKDEFCRRHPADFSPPQQPCGNHSLLLSRRMIAAAIERGSIQFEWMHKRNDTGEQFPADVLLTAMVLDNEPVVQAVVRDITERKRAEEYLKQSERKFAAAFIKNAIPAAITTLKEGRYIEVNDAFMTLMGLKRHEVVGNTSTGIGFITPEQRQIVLNEFRQKGSVDNLELQIRTKGGEFRYGLFNSVRINLLGEDHLLTMVTDITERKRSEEKNENLLIFLQTLFNTIPSPIFCKDRNGIYLDCNKEFENYTGKKRQEIIGKDVYSMYPNDVADIYHEKDLALFRQPGRQVYEHPVIYADGKKRDVVVNKATYMNADGKLAGLVGVMVDISERKQAEEELVRYQGRLEQLVEERTRDLENKTKALEEVNIALKVLLQQREADKKELEDRFLMNINNLVVPFVEKMDTTSLDQRQRAYTSIIKSHLTDIASTMLKKIHQFNLTPTEVEVASLVKDGRSTKEIVRIMGIAASSINTHRNNIRKKLGISKKEVNLRSRLQSLD
jgi:PAS domain S-box-containing protein